VSATLVEEEENAPKMDGMDIDLNENTQGHEPLTKGKPPQPARAEAVNRTNGGDKKL
jgi:hypothetical protein